MYVCTRRINSAYAAARRIRGLASGALGGGKPGPMARAPARNRLVTAMLAATVTVTPASVRKTAFVASLCHGILQQKLLSSPCFSVFQPNLPKGLLLWRSVLFTDTSFLRVHAEA